MLSPLLNLSNAFHGGNRGFNQLAIVADRYISTFLEVDRRVLDVKFEHEFVQIEKTNTRLSFPFLLLYGKPSSTSPCEDFASF